MSSNCYHCGLPNQLAHEFQCDVLGKTEYFCCAGCLAIAETLVANGLTDFYRFRDANSQKPAQLIPQEIRDIEALDTPEILADISQSYAEAKKQEAQLTKILLIGEASIWALKVLVVPLAVGLSKNILVNYQK